MEGSWTSVETNLNLIQSPISGNNNNATYEQKTVAGADMEEVAVRKELEAHLVRVCDRLYVMTHGEIVDEMTPETIRSEGLSIINKYLG